MRGAFVPKGIGSARTLYREENALRAGDDGSIKADFGAPPTRLDDDYRFVGHVALDREELCPSGSNRAPGAGSSRIPVPSGSLLSCSGAPPLPGFDRRSFSA